MQKTITVCDPCQSEDEETVATIVLEIDVNGAPSVMDVCEGHQAEWGRLQQQLVSFQAMARPKTGVKPGRRRPTPEELEENRQIRVWVAEVGIDLPPRGRIPDEIREKFRAAQSPAEVPA